MTYSNMDNVPTQASGTSELLASDWNTYVRDNFDALKYGHLVFANSSARSAGIGSPVVGIMAFLEDSASFEVYRSGGWSAAMNTASIVDNAVSNAKLRDSAGFSVIGKTGTGSGDPADIVAGADSVLRRSGSGNLEFGTIGASHLSLPTGGALTLIDSQTWTSSTTYTLPANAKICYVELIGGGGGGGGGARKGSETTGNNSYCWGGVGGAGGGLYIGWVKAIDLGTPGNSISVTIGAGGAGGAGRTSTSGDGNGGTNGGNTSLGSNIIAVGGLGGARGWWYPNGGPTEYLGYTLYNIYFYSPSNSSYWGRGGAATVSGSKGYIAGGGGGGGGNLELNYGVASAAGGGNISEFSVTSPILNLDAGGAAAGSNGVSGGNATSGSAFNGGGGGGYGTGGIGGNGGNGGLAAGGGGGGAAATANAGNGGSGGSGRIKLWVYG